MSDVKSVIIVCDHAYVNGGQAKVAIDTALVLHERGLEVTVFSGVGPVDQRLIDAGIECICLNQPDLLGDTNRARSAVRGLWNATASAELRKLLARFDPETTIVHVHGWAKSLSPSIGPVVTSGAIPLVYTLHEFFLACPNGGFYDHHQQSICTRTPLGLSCLAANCDPRNRAHKAWRVARQAVLWTAGAMPRHLKDVIYLTDTQVNAVRKYLPTGARLHHLPNPIARTVEARARAEDNDVFLFVGRLSAEKGAELAARAAREARVRIAFAGEGECRDRIKSANSDAEMLGWLKPDQLNALINKARCLVFSSLWYEGMPMSVIEAMQRGLPVLVADRSAAAEFVRHDIDGLHVEMGNLAAWIEGMNLMKEPERVERYSQSSFEAASRFMDPETYANSLMAIYHKASVAQLSDRPLGQVALA
jgi:glycosyltransferase involved in cell wall biosynthesis